VRAHVAIIGTLFFGSMMFLAFGEESRTSSDGGLNKPASVTSQSAERSAVDAFTCTPVRVWDGDGPIWCAEGPRVRLAGIAAREIDGSCSPGHPCPDADAEEAAFHLARLLAAKGSDMTLAPSGHIVLTGPALSCVSEGSAGGKRTAAWCASPIAGDLSCAMVASGMAAKWDRYWKGHRC
jgi:endonuclease YncB( thermonuclease family)